MNRLLPSVALAATFIAAIASCKKKDFVDERLKLQNNTSMAIAAYYDNKYPDVSLQQTKPTVIDARKFYADPGTRMTLSRETNWETYFTDQIPSGKLTIFVFDKEVLANNPWDSVKAHNMVYKRIEVTLDSLRNNNFVVSVN